MIFFDDKTVIPIGGATASGKSAVAIELAVALEGEIVNSDSVQLYKDLPVLTAQPSNKDKEIVKHHLYGVVDNFEQSSASKWLDMFSSCVDGNMSSNVFIAVGGTGLYLSSLMYGLSPIPEVPESIRYQIRQQSKSLVVSSGEMSLYACVVKKDPLIAGNIHPNHTQRLVRAWEVIEHTGISILQWQKEPRQKLNYPRSPLFVIDIEREELKNRIRLRCQKMIDSGAVEEVKELIERTEGQTMYLNKAIGFQEIKKYLEGVYSLDDAIDEIVQNTSLYAKRQQTWFRTQYQAGDVFVIPSDSPSNQASMILKKLYSINSYE